MSHKQNDIVAEAEWDGHIKPKSERHILRLYDKAIQKGECIAPLSPQWRKGKPVCPQCGEIFDKEHDFWLHVQPF